MGSLKQFHYCGLSSMNGFSRCSLLLQLQQDPYPVDVYTSEYMIDGNQIGIVGEPMYRNTDTQKERKHGTTQTLRQLFSKKELHLRPALELTPIMYHSKLRCSVS